MTRSSAEPFEASGTNGASVPSAPSDHHLALSAALLALGVMLSVAESLYLPPLPVPGAKIGLANVVTLLLVVYFRPSDALLNVVMRVVLASLFTGGFMGTAMLFSGASALSAFAVMLIAHRLGGRLMSFIGLSVAGAAASNVAQSGVAVWLMGTTGVLVQLPLLLVVAVIGGVLTGALANAVAARPEVQEAFDSALGVTSRDAGSLDATPLSPAPPNAAPLDAGHEGVR